MLSILLSLFIATLIFILIFFAIVRFFLLVVTVRGQSMFPTLSPNDRLLVLRYWPNKWLRKNQLVVGDLRRVFNPDHKSDDISFLNLDQTDKFIKRVIGLPGDNVEIHISDIDKEIQKIVHADKIIDENFVWKVPDGYCFVRGDNKISGDSVLWGPIPLSYLIGLVIAKLPPRPYLS